jgi:small-conductance mechanosensitive channel
MRIDSKALGFATALGVAGAFTLCTLVVAIVPGSATAFLSYALHIDLTGLTRPLTWGGFVAGLLLTTVYFGLLVAAIAGIYNRRVTRRSEHAPVAGQHLREAR